MSNAHTYHHFVGILRFRCVKGTCLTKDSFSQMSSVFHLVQTLIQSTHDHTPPRKSDCFENDENVNCKRLLLGCYLGNSKLFLFLCQDFNLTCFTEHLGKTKLAQMYPGVVTTVVNCQTSYDLTCIHSSLHSPKYLTEA